MKLRYRWNKLIKRTLLDKPPIFIVGCGHSGTSLTLAILGTHSRIHAIPHESSFLIEGDAGKARKQMLKFDALTIAEGKQRWVEKTPKHIHRIGTILGLRPDAKILLIIRDGRDVACSIQDRTGSLEGGIRRWLDDNEAGRTFWHHPAVHVFRYEEMIEDFERKMRAIFEFLDEEYEPAVEDFSRTERRFYSTTIEKPASAFGKDHKQYRNWQINQALFDGRGRWKRLSEEELRVVNEIGKDLLLELGYG